MGVLSGGGADTAAAALARALLEGLGGAGGFGTTNSDTSETAVSLLKVVLVWEPEYCTSSFLMPSGWDPLPFLTLTLPKVPT